MRTVLRYAFGALGLNKVSLDVLEYNTRAIRTYERLGFHREGVHREDGYKDGRFVHVIRMSMLARELDPGMPACISQFEDVPRRRAVDPRPILRHLHDVLDQHACEPRPL